MQVYLNGTYYSELNATAQGQIASHTWGVGAVANNDSSLSNSIAEEKAYTWTGNIGLISTTDYVRASTNASCTSVSAYYSNSSCYNSSTHNWMYLNDDWWTITPDASNSNSNYVFIVASNGSLYSYYANWVDTRVGSYTPRPAIYLSSDVQITGGDGSEGSPYQLEN